MVNVSFTTFLYNFLYITTNFHSCVILDKHQNMYVVRLISASIPQTVVSSVIDRGLDKWQRQVYKFKFQVLLSESYTKMCMGVELQLLYPVVVVSAGGGMLVLKRVVDSAVY